MRRLLLFHLEDRRYGIWLDSVDRVLRAAEVTPLPRAPEIVLGALDVGGTCVAVVDVRRRLGLLRREVLPQHVMILARAAGRAVALVVDAVSGVREHGDMDVIGSADLLPGQDCVDGLLRLPDGLVVLHDLDQFLSASEEAELDRCLEEKG